MNANEKVKHVIEQTGSLVCIGLDVDPDRLPPHLKKGSDPVFRFNKAIIDATAHLVAAYKPNLAFYEALGTEGWDILQRTVSYVPEGILTIGDAKRGDIGNTAKKYAAALFGLGFDYVTVNPYLGWDSVGPFVEDETRGVFVLCLTSNKSSRDFQYRETGGQTLYQSVAATAVRWNTGKNCGLVVGATHPEELAQVRQIAPDLPFLIPGIGAQGGDLEASVSAGTDAGGSMAVINSSRGIIYASDGEDFAEAAREKAEALKAGINAVREKQ